MTTPLPFWPTINNAFLAPARLRREFFKISWLWLVIITPVILLYSALAWPHLNFIYCINWHEIRQALPAHRMEMHFYSFLSCILIGIPGGSIAVAWHRLILRNEMTSTTHYLRLDKVVWSYIILAALIYFIEELPNIFRIVFPTPTDITHENALHTLVISLSSLILSCITLFYAVRMSVGLPARALGKYDITLKDVLKRTQGNFWRLFGGHIFCFLPFLPVLFYIPQLGCSNELTGIVLYAAQLWISLCIMLPVYLTFLSLAFRHFFERDESTPDIGAVDGAVAGNAIGSNMDRNNGNSQ